MKIDSSSTLEWGRKFCRILCQHNKYPKEEESLCTRTLWNAVSLFRSYTPGPSSRESRCRRSKKPVELTRAISHGAAYSPIGHVSVGRSRGSGGDPFDHTHNWVEEESLN